MRDPLCETCTHPLSDHEFEDVEDGVPSSADCYCANGCACREYINDAVFVPLSEDLLNALEFAAADITLQIARERSERSPWKLN